MPEQPSISCGQATSLEESYAWCVRFTRRSRSNFYYSFYTLRRALFRDMCVLYAFMRHTDDLGDEPAAETTDRAAAIENWKVAFDSALRGERTEHPLLPALANVVARRHIPVEYLHAVIDGVRMDVDPQGFDTFDELAEYCYRVAGAVGLCCIHIWGFRSPEAIPLAIDCGLAFQLTNILRDLGEDADLGRCYLPREELARFGLTPRDLANRTRDDRFRAMMAFQVARARDYFHRAQGLTKLLAADGKPILAAMLQTYGEVLAKIERRNYDVYSRRVRLSRPHKLAIVAWSLLRHGWQRQG